MAAKRAVQYAVVDAFTGVAFKGNPAAVCLLEAAADERWMKSVAVEFNLSQTAFLYSDPDAAAATAAGVANPRFHLRWFTPASEVELCGHATLATAHFLFTSVLAKCDMVEFMTKSGLLTAKKVLGSKKTNFSNCHSGEEEEKFLIELDLPMIGTVGCNSNELPLIPETLNGASVINVQKTATSDDIIVELSSAKEVADVLPNIEEIKKCTGRGVLVTGPAAPESGYDFFTRFFCPKFGINEDPVCGSAHCALAPYWGRKLGKQKLTAFMASQRSGTLYLELDDADQRVRIRGEAVTVMVGTLLA